jgi:hypothetical protein
MPLPRHCSECDKPFRNNNILDVTCNKCKKENNMNTYYDPKQDMANIEIVAGDYPGHIVAAKVKRIPIQKGKYLCDIYNYSLEVAPEVKKHSYQDNSGAIIDSSVYHGIKIRSGGTFLFIAPEEGDTHQANPGGNKRFMDLCEAVGKDCPVETVTINGEEREVYGIPSLDPGEMNGKPVIATVGLGRAYKNSDGDEVRPMEVKSCIAWPNGNARDMEQEDLPF